MSEHRLRLSVEQYRIDKNGVRSTIRSHNIDVPGFLNGAFRAVTGLMDAIIEGVPEESLRTIMTDESCAGGKTP